MRLLIESARIWDGSGADPYVGAVLIDGGRFAAVHPAEGGPLVVSDAIRVDACGMFLMPGLVEGHAHLSFTDISRGTALGEIPPEDHTLLAMDAARKLLGAGFTSACSAASAKIRLDVAVRDAIARGLFDGPRLLAASPELTVTGGLGDARRLHLHQDSFGLAVDGPDEVRRVTRLCLREGCDTIKLNISGDFGVESALADTAVMTDAEIAAAVEAAHAIDRRVAAHARASEAVKRALRNGVDIVYHCDFADAEALDMLEAARDRIFVGPAIGIVRARLATTSRDPSPQGRIVAERVSRILEASCRTYAEMRRRKIRVVIGGDYGFADNPQGSNARDLAHFVELFGYTPTEALVAATRIGGEIMRRGDELGMIRNGYLADLLLVDGDPLGDPRVLQDRNRLALVVKDGVPYAPCDGPPHARRLGPGELLAFGARSAGSASHRRQGP
jgi:imidazolonepropionase-like amidohydrolase